MQLIFLIEKNMFIYVRSSSLITWVFSKFLWPFFKFFVKFCLLFLTIFSQYWFRRFLFGHNSSKVFTSKHSYYYYYLEIVNVVALKPVLQDGPYAAQHCRGGVSTNPRVLAAFDECAAGIFGEPTRNTPWWWHHCQADILINHSLIVKKGFHHNLHYLPISVAGSSSHTAPRNAATFATWFLSSGCNGRPRSVLLWWRLTGIWGHQQSVQGHNSRRCSISCICKKWGTHAAQTRFIPNSFFKIRFTDIVGICSCSEIARIIR